jgi:hypothetical protein
MLFCNQSDAEAKGDFSPRRGWAQGVLVYERELKGDCHIEQQTGGEVVEGLKSRKENANAQETILKDVKWLGSDTKWCLD